MHDVRRLGAICMHDVNSVCISVCANFVRNMFVFMYVRVGGD